MAGEFVRVVESRGVGVAVCYVGEVSIGFDGGDDWGVVEDRGVV